MKSVEDCPSVLFSVQWQGQAHEMKMKLDFVLLFTIFFLCCYCSILNFSGTKLYNDVASTLFSYGKTKTTIYTHSSKTKKQKGSSSRMNTCEPVWPGGKALGRFESASALLSLQKLWSLDTVL